MFWPQGFRTSLTPPLPTPDMFQRAIRKWPADLHFRGDQST
ncbi:hypothetical protein Z947_110 [Sulfitobacter geojensis]|nr:hypothetical protein Z947_110 [Sulfitobacter geojensis]